MRTLADLLPLRYFQMKYLYINLTKPNQKFLKTYLDY